MLSLRCSCGAIQTKRCTGANCGGSGGIWILDPQGKKLDRIVHGAPATTNLAFGGTDWTTLYFTSRSHLGAVKVKIPGMPVPTQKRAVVISHWPVRVRGLPGIAVGLPCLRHGWPAGASLCTTFPFLAQEVFELVHQLLRVKVVLTPWARSRVTRRVIVLL